jgi:TolA-binding protein
MPCSDGMPRNWETQQALTKAGEELEKSKQKSNQIIDEQGQRINYLEGALCALLTEIHKHPIGPEFVKDASANGQINIDSFWEKHKSRDAKRLLASVTKNYSKHEITMLKEIIKGII